MTDIQIRQIGEMRNLGYGYSRIAKELGISENTVKSFCRRRELTRRETPQQEGLSFCPSCGAAIKQKPKRKPRRFCSDNCRIKWWKEHMDLVKKKAVYRLVCFNCGKEFESYGHVERKYCGHRCYIERRFKKSGGVLGGDAACQTLAVAGAG